MFASPTNKVADEMPRHIINIPINKESKPPQKDFVLESSCSRRISFSPLQVSRKNRKVEEAKTNKKN
jgi:hypothetical protein